MTTKLDRRGHLKGRETWVRFWWESMQVFNLPLWTDCCGSYYSYDVTARHGAGAATVRMRLYCILISLLTHMTDRLLFIIHPIVLFLYLLLEAHLKCYEWEKHTYLPMATGTLFAFCLWFSHYDLRTYCGLIISNRRKSRFACRGGELMS